MNEKLLPFSLFHHLLTFFHFNCIESQQKLTKSSFCEKDYVFNAAEVFRKRKKEEK
jgi:hypothetical protein